MVYERNKLNMRLILTVLLLGCLLYTPSRIFALQSPKNTAEPAVDQLAESLPAHVAEVDAVSELIYEGKFDVAGKLTENSPYNQNASLQHLTSIIAEHRAINDRRESAREAAFKEQLAELEKLQTVEDVNVTADVNDANSIVSQLSAINKVTELANEQQRKTLLTDPVVKQTFQRAIEKAAEFEAEGKWLDAYLTCYNWLQTIDKDNKVYSDHAKQLMEKANIVASFQDSPCETSQQRYEGVKKKLFIRAVDTLKLSYVSPIDYHEMASKAIKRCQLLAEVMAASFSQIQQGTNVISDSQGSPKGFSPPDSAKLAAWSVSLNSLLDDINNSPTGIGKDKFLDIFENVLAINDATVELPTAVLVAQFAEAALSALDPYTVMIWPRQVQDFEKLMTNEFTGIGIHIGKPKGLLTVASLLPDTPAYYSGLDAQDVIVSVDGIDTKDMSLSCAVKYITGPAGTKVTLTIRRQGEDNTRDITITRAKIIVPTIRGWKRTQTGTWLYMIDEENKIGYVRITSFSERTSSDLNKALNQLEADGLQGLILDLRFNTGGLLPSAIAVVDKFIEEGLIVSTRPRFGTWTYEAAHRKGTHPKYPLVILTNRYSASASEIVAGALQDKTHRRAVLVGERTHGKGSVQTISHRPGARAQLKYTMAYYHLPSGQRVESKEAMKKQGREDWGITPDIEIKLRLDESRKANDVHWDNSVLVQANHDNGTVPLKKHPFEETLKADPQLAVGVLVIKTQLIQSSTLAQAHANQLELKR